jgi:hypothetical protein
MRHLGDYLHHRRAEDEDFPDKIEELEVALKAKFVYTKGQPVDEDKHGLFVAYRNAVYVQGDVETCKEVIMFLDAFVTWRVAQNDFTEDTNVPPLKINIFTPPDFDMDLKVAQGEEEPGDMDCAFEVTHGDIHPHVKITDAPPPTYPARMLVANIEIFANKTLSIVWSGNTMPFRRCFEALNIGGKTHKKKETDRYGEYYRKKENISIDGEEKTAEVLDLFGKPLVRKSPVLVRVRAMPENDEPSVNFLAKLKGLENVIMIS